MYAARLKIANYRNGNPTTRLTHLKSDDKPSFPLLAEAIFDMLAPRRLLSNQQETRTNDD
jgi:hypothetical protein